MWDFRVWWWERGLNNPVRCNKCCNGKVSIFLWASRVSSNQFSLCVGSEGWIGVSGNEGVTEQSVIYKACITELQKPIYVWERIPWWCYNMRTFLEGARGKYVWGDRWGSRAVQDHLPWSFMHSTGNEKSWKAFGQRSAMPRTPESSQLRSESQRRIILPLYPGHLDVSYP